MKILYTKIIRAVDILTIVMHSPYTEVEMHNLELDEQETDEVQLLVECTTHKIESKPIARFAHVIRHMFMPQLHKCINDTVHNTSVPVTTVTEEV